MALACDHGVVSSRDNRIKRCRVSVRCAMATHHAGGWAPPQQLVRGQVNHVKHPPFRLGIANVDVTEYAMFPTHVHEVRTSRPMVESSTTTHSLGCTPRRSAATCMSHHAARRVTRHPVKMWRHCGGRSRMRGKWQHGRIALGAARAYRQIAHNALNSACHACQRSEHTPHPRGGPQWHPPLPCRSSGRASSWERRHL